MLSSSNITVHLCIKSLQAGYQKTYDCSCTRSDAIELIVSVANMAIERIALSDAAYHNIEHTLRVALAGQEILLGKQIQEGNVTERDWLHGIVALLCHDIGYLRGICRQDRIEQGIYATGKGDTTSLPPHATDASLNPYHVDRGKLFVREYLSDCRLLDLDIVQHNIELTRFPVPKDEAYQQTGNYASLARAADLIGQLADPKYLEKLPALYCEFEENGTNQRLGYKNLGELRADYPNFFWNVAHPYLKDGLRYLQATKIGQQTIDNLYRNVSIVENELWDAAKSHPIDKLSCSVKL
ncbi:HD domain-containing protein [Lusitaniella coriacea LEGE 07157]|uniref:HD domain-containing protein n=1 Tax=Lusitaniella coriacea LEGE 07157 TaxID=945747 RepID=A0A8J7DLC1_9CYAN|nr:HD domain-containing protein [Lusitaniella coriacea]MBE9114713.1 HD domain-containing protein [Lusitaniella coriacea LEGE 07157]